MFLAHKLDINVGAFNSVYLGYLGKETHLIQEAVEMCESLADRQLAIITNGFTDVQTSRIGSSPLFNTFERIIISWGSWIPEA